MKGRIFSFFAIIAATFFLGVYPAFAQEAPSFPSCSSPTGSIVAQYADGTHGIVGDDNTYTGNDTVYAIDATRVIQCFCNGSQGIQTNWWQIPEMSFDTMASFENQGWNYVPTGEAWGLANQAYLAQNIAYSCTGGGSSSNSNGGGNNGSGGTSGSSAAPVCNDTAPGSAPTITNVTYGTNSVTLTWTPAADPVSYYLIAYGTEPGVYTYGNPNIGNTTTYTIQGLSGGTTYYFAIKAVHGCMPGPFSNEVSSDPQGGFLPQPAEGFSPSTLGITDRKNTPLTSDLSVVSGICGNCIWWPVLLGEAIALLLYYVFVVRRVKNKKELIARFIIPVATYIIFLMINHGCFTGVWWKLWTWHIAFASWPCKYFWLLDGLVCIAFAFIWVMFKKLHKTKQVTATKKHKK